MIDDEVREEVDLALRRAEAVELEGGVLDGLAWPDGDGEAVPLEESWRTEPRLPLAVRDSGRIRPADVRAVAADCRERGEWTPLLVAVNAWAYGSAGWGHWRTRRLVSLPDREARLQAAVATLDDAGRDGGPVGAYYVLNNEGGLHGWGPPYFTRFLAFAGRAGDPEAVCLDATLARAVNSLVPGSHLPAGEWSTGEYAYHLGILYRMGDVVGRTPAVVAEGLRAKFRD